jgi:cell division protein FtsL
MFRFLNALMVLGLLVAAYFNYRLEHATRSGEREIARLQAQISEEQENYKLLTAEWSLLTRPDRIQHLADKHLKLKVMSPMQAIRYSDIPERVPKERIRPPDPIGDVLKQLEGDDP